VAFASFASNLVGGDSNDETDVFVRNLSNNAITVVSRSSGAGGAVGLPGEGEGGGWRVESHWLHVGWAQGHVGHFAGRRSL
jgi:hypothetical protein